MCAKLRRKVSKTSDITSKQKLFPMRYLLIFMFFVGIFVVGKRSCNLNSNGFVFGPGIKGKGPVQTENRDVRDFHAIQLEVSADVEVSVGETYFVEVQAQENLLPVLKTELKDGALKIYFDENVSYSESLKIRVSAPAFDAFSIGGSGTIRVLTPIQSEKMDLAIAGSGDIYLTQGDFGNLKTSIAGSGGIELGGKASNMKSEIAGSGDVKAKALTANELNVSISGSGTVTCDIAQTLKAQISGSGDVFYTGEPSVDADVSGSGKVKKMAVQ